MTYWDMYFHLKGMSDAEKLTVAKSHGLKFHKDDTGRWFASKPHDYKDLQFVSRKDLHGVIAKTLRAAGVVQ